MSQLSIKVSAKGEAMIATLQKEIFNRRRKKVTASQVVETLVESGAKSQSDKRYAASWKNLIKEIEKAAHLQVVTVGGEALGVKVTNFVNMDLPRCLGNEMGAPFASRGPPPGL